MKHVDCEPINLFGMNLPQMYGGFLKPQYWESKHNDKLFDRKKILRGQGIDVLGWDTETASSCDDYDTSYIQRYDDDKMELMGASDRLNLAVFNMSQFGQAKSPYHIEFRDDVDEDKIIYIAIDGEFF